MDFVEVGVRQIGFFIRGVNSEKFTAKATIFLGSVFATSFIPFDTTGDPCAAGGTAIVRAFDMFCGGTVMTQPTTIPSSYDDRVIHTAVGLPSAPKISIGDDDDGSGPTPPPCPNLVVVTTSDGSTFTGCAGSTNTRPVLQESWRQR